MERVESLAGRTCQVYLNTDKFLHSMFTQFDGGDKGHLTRIELHNILDEVIHSDFSMGQVEILYSEFDRNDDGKIDFAELKVMVNFLKGESRRKGRRASTHRSSTITDDLRGLSVDSLPTTGERHNPYGDAADLAISVVLDKAVRKAQRQGRDLLRSIIKSIYPYKDILCIQDDMLEDLHQQEHESGMQSSLMLDFADIMDDDDSFTDEEEYENPMDPDIPSAFPASEMRCLALVSHNGMKKSMREFVTANKNLLKKFRLTGTNSTMTMLREVFKDEPPGSIVFGPACASGPLGGDAELVAHMVAGKIGGVFFFQDPMNAHPHKADIECLLRQALVHNVVLAETPSSALMMCNTLRQALIGKGHPELIPSFFFSLQSPTVEAYKAGQKAVVDSHKK